MTQVFGILNVTPDSFSDGGKNFSKIEALKSAEKMLQDGVFAIDIGAESTRPNAKVISWKDEIERLSKILPEVVKMGGKVSLDTRNFETAKWGFENGISILNDVSGLQDSKMISLIKQFNGTAVFMHSLTVPANPTITMKTETMLAEIHQFAKAKISQCQKAGILKENLIFDFGIGFGKTAEQSILLIKNTSFFADLGVKLLVGHSRKSFLKHAFAERFAESIQPSLFEKDLMTTTFSTFLLEKVAYLRLHNTSLIGKMFVEQA